MSHEPRPLVGDWLSVDADRLVLHTGKVDIGQRISTALVRIAREETTLPDLCIDVAPVRTDAAPDEGVTSGSNSLEQSGAAIRLAAATLRGLVLARAADLFGGVPEDWTLEEGLLNGPGTNRPAKLLDLAAEIDLDVPVDASAGLRPPRNETPPPMRGIADMVSGQHLFVHDLEADGMLHARVVHPPCAGARLAGIARRESDRLSEAGLQLVRDGSFLAIAGEEEWAVVKAAQSLSVACRWDGAGGLSEEDAFGRLTLGGALRHAVVDGVPQEGPVPPDLPAPDIVRRYERPFTLHGSLAPSAALACHSKGVLRIHTHSQGVYPLRDSIAESLGLGSGEVELVHAPGSGCYGHNGADDAAFEAALVAMALPGTPILLKRSRSDEHAWEPFGSAMAVEVAAAIGEDGCVAAFSAEVFSGAHRGRPRPGPNRAGPSRLLANHRREAPIGPIPPAPNLNRHGGMHRNLDPVYAFPEKRLVRNLIGDLPHRTSALRCLGGAANVFALESFMDEVARLQGRDPLEFRLAHMDDPRGIAVLRRLESVPGPEVAEAGGSGIAYAQYKNSMTRVGVRVDLRVGDDAEIRLVKAAIVADAGRVVDRDGLQAQLEGGFMQGASWALRERVAWNRDGITSLDWDSYPVLRFDQAPNIDVDVLDQPSEASVGAGEAAPGPAVAAIANALFDATGIRMRRLPFTPETILGQALAN